MKKISLFITVSLVINLNVIQASGAPTIKASNVISRLNPDAISFVPKTSMDKKRAELSHALSLHQGAVPRLDYSSLVRESDGDLAPIDYQKLNAKHARRRIISFVASDSARFCTDNFASNDINVNNSEKEQVQDSSHVAEKSVPIKENVGLPLTKGQIKKARIAADKESARLLAEQKIAHARIYSPLAKLAAQQGAVLQNRLSAAGTPTSAEVKTAKVLENMNSSAASFAAAVTLPEKILKPSKAVDKTGKKATASKKGKIVSSAHEGSNLDDDLDEFFAQERAKNANIKPFVDEKAEIHKQLVTGLFNFWSEINQLESPWTTGRADLYSAALSRLKNNPRSLSFCRTLLKTDTNFAQAYNTSLMLAKDLADTFNERYKDDPKAIAAKKIGITSSFDKLVAHLESLPQSTKK